MSKYFCDHCNRECNGYKEVELTSVRQIRGVSIAVPHEGLVCEHCGHELYLDDIETQVTKTAVDIYRRKAKLLSPEKLTSLIETTGIRQLEAQGRKLDPKKLSRADRELVHKTGAEELAGRLECSVSELFNSIHGGVHSAQTDAGLRKILGSTATAVA